MSALQLHATKVHKDSAVCLMEGCNRKGRYRISLAGYPLISDRPLTKGEPEVVCDRCQKTWKSAFAVDADPTPMEAAA